MNQLEESLYTVSKYDDRKKTALYEMTSQIKQANTGIDLNPYDYTMNIMTQSNLRTYKQAKEIFDLVQRYNVFVLNIIQACQKQNISKEDYSLLYEYQRLSLINRLDKLSFELFESVVRNEKTKRKRNRFLEFMKGL